jgi:hypothetical protein
MRSTPRVFSLFRKGGPQISNEKYRENYDRIFKKCDCEECECEKKSSPCHYCNGRGCQYCGFKKS